MLVYSFLVNTMEHIIIFGCFLFVATVWSSLIYVYWLEPKKEKESYKTWVQSYNWYYNPKRDRKTYRRYKHLNQLQPIFPAHVFDVVKGTWDGYPFVSFNANFKVKNKPIHYLGVVMIQIEQHLPKLHIRRKTSSEGFRNSLGLKKYKFKSVEFSKHFTVSCRNKNFAYDFCNPEMMEYLLSKPNTEIAINKNMLIVFNYCRYEMEPNDVEENLNQLIQVRKLMPK